MSADTGNNQKAGLASPLGEGGEEGRAGMEEPTVLSQGRSRGAGATSPEVNAGGEQVRELSTGRKCAPDLGHTARAGGG